VALLTACSNDPAPANDELGIDSFEVNDDGLKTTMVGRDASGVEIGHLELVHGLFTISEAFRPDYPDMTEIVGRKLDIVVKGEQMSYENAGFDPVLHLPMPMGTPALAAFVSDPQVKGVLGDWRLGFDEMPQLVSGGAETAYTVDNLTGNSPVYFPFGTSDYGVVRPGVVANSCAGGTTADRALRLTRTVAQGFPYDEYIISQCCANATWAAKSCPTNPNAASCTVSTANDGILSTYGCVKLTAACKGGPNYGNPNGAPTGGICGILRTATGMTSCFGAGETQQTFQLKVVAVGTGRGIAAGTATATIASGTCGVGDFRCSAGTCGTNTCLGTPTVSQVTNAGYTFASLTWPSGNVAQFNYYINDGGSCQAASECLSGACSSGVCGVPPPSCRSYGQSCTTSADCCKDDPMFCDNFHKCNYF
jgi:hypothetical protein